MDLKLLIKNFVSKDLKEAWNLICVAQKITLLTHFKPDGDGISACAAFEAMVAKHFKNKKQIETIYPTHSEFKLLRVPKNISINSHKQIPDLIVAFDTAGYDRLYYPQVFKSIPLINIDHHISNSIKGTINFVFPNAASTCEVVYELIKIWAPEIIDKSIAETLLVGILYDTQVFHTQSTQSSTLKAAAELIDFGADLFTLKNELLSHKDPNIIKLWGYLLNNIKFSNNKKAAWAFISQDELKNLRLSLSSIVGFNNFIAEISGVDVTALFYETEEGLTKVSLRSKVTDVNAIANQFGGGGHIHAAGILSDKSLSETISLITNKFEQL